MTTRAFITGLGLALCLAPLACTDDADDQPAAEGTSTTGDTSSTSDDPSTTTVPDTSSTTTGEDTGDTGDDTSGPDGSDDGSDEGSTTTADAPVVTLETTLGDIVIQLDDVAAPITTANFLAYVESGYYDGSDDLGATIFHRVIPGFMIQGGGLTEAMVGKATMAAIMNESGNGLTNVRGSIAMARTSEPHSATSQFFINVVDNLGLDDPPGYAVFGEVVSGMDVVDAIVAVETTTVGGYQDVPVEPIIIEAATIR